MSTATQRIEIRERKKEGEYWVVDIDPWFEPGNQKRGFRRKIEVVSKSDLDEITPSGWSRKWTKAQVSWPSVGGPGSAEISLFAEALRIAADYAKRMDAEHGTQSC